MGTRNLICVFYRGRFVIAQYSRYNGLPEDHGVVLLKFLRESRNITRLKNGLRNTYEISEEDEEARQAKRQINGLRGLEKLAWYAFLIHEDSWITREITNSLKPSLHRETGARILQVIANADDRNKVPVVVDLSFANNSDCEWAYIVNLDTEELEIFKGYENKSPGNPFGDIGGHDDTVPAFVTSFKLSQFLELGEEEFLDRVSEAENKRTGFKSSIV